MSIQAIQWAYTQNIDNATAKFLLVTLANYGNENFICWPSIKRLAKDMSVSKRAVRLALQRLSDAELIKIKPQHATDGGAKSNLYVLTAEPPLNNIHPPLNQVHNPPEPGSPNPLIEPSKEKKEKKKRIRKTANGHPPPDGVAPDLWSDFLSQRKQLKAQNTDRAIKIVSNRLADNKAKTGESYTAQIERAIESGWKTVWPLRTNGNAKPACTPPQRPKRQIW